MTIFGRADGHNDGYLQSWSLSSMSVFLMQVSLNLVLSLDLGSIHPLEVIYLPESIHIIENRKNHIRKKSPIYHILERKVKSKQKKCHPSWGRHAVSAPRLPNQPDESDSQTKWNICLRSAGWRLEIVRVVWRGEFFFLLNEIYIDIHIYTYLSQWIDE